MKYITVLIVAAACAAGADLRFEPAGGGEFRFDTGVLRGTLRAKGRSAGLSSVVHIPSSATLSRGMGFFGHYRVFSTNRRYGNGAWDWPSEAVVRGDGSVEARWPATEERPFEMRAVYRLSSPATLDVVTFVRPVRELPGFEVFLATYFAEQFTNSLVYARGGPGPGNGPRFVAAERSYGDWQVFPRNRDLLALIGDGRWNIEPHPVNWVMMPALAQPLGVRRDRGSGRTAILMSPPEDCFAISTPHQTESHYSMYLSLFGRTIRAGETGRARARLVIAESPDDPEILRLYRMYLKEAR